MRRRKHPRWCRTCKGHRTRHHSAVCSECRGLPKVESASDGGVILLSQLRLSQEAAIEFANMIVDHIEGAE